MKIFAIVGLIALSGPALAVILPQGDASFKCQTTGGFFDFSPAGAIASCKQEITEFCKTQNAPPIVGKVTAEPSGFGTYARAEVNFQCASAEDLAQRQRSVVEAQRQEVDRSKRTCSEDFGFVPGTVEFGGCMMELQKQLVANRRADQDRAAQNDIAEAQIAQKRRAASEQAAIGAYQSLNEALKPAPQSRSTTTCKSTFGGREMKCESESR